MEEKYLCRVLTEGAGGKHVLCKETMYLKAQSGGQDIPNTFPYKVSLKTG